MMWLIDAIPPPPLKVAVTDWPPPFAISVHAPAPVQAPLHPLNVEPGAGAALKLTEAPLLKFALHVVPQLIPGGLLVTVPEPAPARVTVIDAFEGAGELPAEEAPPPQPDARIPQSTSRAPEKHKHEGRFIFHHGINSWMKASVAAVVLPLWAGY